jgi:16S rRNA G966 N2-methylase RsmD
MEQENTSLEIHSLALPFPELQEQEYRLLVEDIRNRGLLEPVTLYEGKILDGRHRYRACREAGVEVVFEEFSGDDAVGYVIAKNIVRRHLTPGQRAALVLEYRELVERLEEEARARKEANLKRGSEPPNGSREPFGKLGSRSQHLATLANVSPATVKRVERVKQEDPILYEQIKTGEVEAGVAEQAIKRRIRQRQSKSSKSPQILIKPEGVRQGDFREVLNDIPDHSVDLVLTDPPYGKEYLGLWGDLGAFSARILKESGILIAYSGQLYLPQVLQELQKHLEYWWCMAVVHKSASGLTPLGQPVRKVINHWKPLVMFIPRQGLGISETFKDLVPSGGRAKEAHNWGQPESEAEWIIENFSPQEGVVVDPFAGSGSVGRACQKTQRTFFGAEVHRAAEA